LLSKADLCAFLSEAENLEAHRRRLRGRGVWLVLLGLTALPEPVADAAFRYSKYLTLDYNKPQEHIEKLISDSRHWSLYVARYNACAEAVRHFAQINLVADEGEQLDQGVDTLAKLHRRVKRHRCDEHL
jgi:hypothetical protein